MVYISFLLPIERKKKERERRESIFHLSRIFFIQPLLIRVGRYSVPPHRGSLNCSLTLMPGRTLFPLDAILISNSEKITSPSDPLKRLLGEIASARCQVAWRIRVKAFNFSLKCSPFAFSLTFSLSLSLLLPPHFFSVHTFTAFSTVAYYDSPGYFNSEMTVSNFDTRCNFLMQHATFSRHYTIFLNIPSILFTLSFHIFNQFLIDS